MRILHIHNRSSCIRAFKQSTIMLARGHQVESVAQMHGFGFNIYTAAHAYGDPQQLQRTIAESKADVLHVHTEPDRLVAFVKEHAGGRPVVMDVHDPSSLRTRKAPDADETAAFAFADAFIHVSEPCQKHSEEKHGKDKPSTIIYSYVNENFYNQARDVNWMSICYEGGLTSLVADEKGQAYFRNLQYPVQKFIEAGFNVSLFAAGDKPIDSSYESMGAMLVRDLTYTTMLNGIRNHAFGFVGAGAVTAILNAAMPNKLFEYISQGVVPVCWNADTAGEFVQREGIGIWLKPDDDLTDLKDKFKRGPAYRKNLLKIRQRFTMESQAEQLEQLYRSLF
jgi:glycosyltransferase involved in cell wall biosynthesis